jgi:long-chain acyl-CoA synthetase
MTDQINRLPDILDNLYHWESNKPNEIFLREPVNGEYQELTWKETALEVRKMAGYLKSLKLPTNSRIAIISKNCSHWLIADLAIMMSGHISVPLYPNLTSGSVNQIILHSEAVVAFIGKLDNYEEMEQGLPEGVLTISFPYYKRAHHLQWDEIIEHSEPILENVQRGPLEIATIIYTSGTTGVPKGVMHSFHNYAFVALHAIRTLGFQTGERFFSYLPLCHIAEKLLVQVGCMHVGGTISFSESLETFPKNMKDAKMTVFLAVPRIWSKFQQSILNNIPQNLLEKLLRIPIVSDLTKLLIKRKMGFNTVKYFFTGAAAAPVALLEFFRKLGINIQEAYAMTENCCYSHVNLRESIKIGSVGKSLPHSQIKISDEGEILVKHEALMHGYFKEKELTQSTFTSDGYLRTGDEGKIDKEGYLFITGRIKDLFKSSKGKYIAPLPIELMLMENEFIDQVCVVGHGLPQPIALSILSEEGLKKTKEQIHDHLSELLSAVNNKLDYHETLARIIVLKDSWSISNGILTPTLKVKRKMIDELYSAFYEKWFIATETIVWI